MIVHSAVALTFFPLDCYLDGVAQAGAVLKLMDNAAGVASVRHCHSNVVTASLEAVDFLHPVFNGDLLEVHARPIFTSDRSMDVEVNVYSQNMRQHERVLATTSVFTFVSLDEFGRPQKIPAIAPTTDEEKLRYELVRAGECRLFLSNPISLSLSSFYFSLSLSFTLFVLCIFPVVSSMSLHLSSCIFSSISFIARAVSHSLVPHSL